MGRTKLTVIFFPLRKQNSTRVKLYHEKLNYHKNIKP